MVNWRKLKRRIQSGEKDVLIEGDFFGIIETLLSSVGLLRPLQSLSFYNSIPNEAFSGCRSLQSVTIPSGVTSIGDHAFYGCRSLTAVTIPDSVTSIGGEHAFSFCTSLKSVTIPDSVTSIGEHAFSGCSSLTAVTIPDSVTSIGEHAFLGCSNLTTVMMTSGLEMIAYGAFSGCSSLTNVTIPSSVTSIRAEAFAGSSQLDHIVTDTPILLQASNDHRETMGIHQACKIITPAALLQKTEVQRTLSRFNHLKLTSAQKVFLYMNQHRWPQLSVEELREHVGDVRLDLLEVLGHEKWGIAQHVRDQGVGALGKVGGDKATELAQALAQSTAFSTSKNISLWSTLAQIAKSDHTNQERNNSPK